MSNLKKFEDRFLNILEQEKIQTVQDVEHATTFYDQVAKYFRMMHYYFEALRGAHFSGQDEYINVGWMAKKAECFYCDAKAFCEMLKQRGLLEESEDGKKNYVVKKGMSKLISSVLTGSLIDEPINYRKRGSDEMDGKNRSLQSCSRC